MAVSQSSPRPVAGRRTDAVRNRATILRVADDAFAAGGEDVLLDQIARRTGLGRATVYRHFPDRQALAVAVVRHQMDLMREMAGAGDGSLSFRDVLQEMFTSQASRRALVLALRRLPEREQQRHAHAVVSVLTPAFEQSRDAGQIRADAVPADLVLMLEMMEALLKAAPRGAERDATVQRLIQVLLDGLFTGPPVSSHRTAVDDIATGSA